MSAPVDILSLSKSYGQQSILKSLNWQIPSGSIIGLLGRNGAGKSTLIECLLGLRDFQQGGVRLFGENVNQLSAASKAKIGYVPQTPDIFGWLTAKQLFAYFKAMYPRWNDAKIATMMRNWDLPSDKIINKLSIGQKQKISIIRALAHEPELLILDEPVSSLDPAGRRDFLRELVAQIDQQTTIVFSTHILSDLERIAMDVAFLNHGCISLQQPLDVLMDNTRKITGSTSTIQKLDIGNPLKRAELANGYSSVLAQFSEAEISKLHQHTDMRIEKLGLEDLFIELTQ